MMAITAPVSSWFKVHYCWRVLLSPLNYILLDKLPNLREKSWKQKDPSLLCVAGGSIDLLTQITLTALHYFLALAQISKSIFRWETGKRQHLKLFFISPNQLITHHLSTAWMTYHARLTPLEPPCPLQNLSVTLANWGMNRPTPFLMGAFAVIQPCFNQRALAVILLFLSDQSRYSETGR